MIRTIRAIFVEVVILILNIKRVRIIFLFRQYSKVMYYIGSIFITFIQEWIELRQ